MPFLDTDKDFQEKVTAINYVPGLTDTPLIGEITAINLIVGRGSAAIKKSLPLGRMGQPDDIAHAAAFLASEHAGYVTGQTISVRGGVTMAG